MSKKCRYGFYLFSFFSLHILLGSLSGFTNNHPCCHEDPKIEYYLSPKPTQKFQYRVQYETFFSAMIGKEKGFFIILPGDFDQDPGIRYPVLFLLHGYNFYRNGFWWKVVSPERAKEIQCKVKEEEYHWLLHEDIAAIAYAMTDSKNKTYRDLEKSLEERFEEVSKRGGLAKKDYTPKEIAISIVSHNLHQGNLGDPYQSLQKMIIVLPDGDSGFYTDENEGRSLFPETKDKGGCDHFNQGEALSYSLLPFLYMKPGALGKYESYFLELVRHIESHPRYRERILPKRGIGGASMGGFGAIKLGLKYPHLFQSMSSQSGLLDLERMKNKWMLKMLMPEFLEVFGRLEPQSFPPSSSIDLSHIRANNPVTLVKQKKWNQLPSSIYFDYGEKEGYSGITEGNRSFEKATVERSHQVPVQPFNGGAGHNYQFWRSRLGNVLKHHSDILRKE
jgi:S-formylglutathione hydrolase FrmB